MSVILLKSSGSNIEGIEIINTVVAVEGDTAGCGFDVGFTHGYDSVCAVVCDNLRDTEKLLVVVRVSVVDDTEKFVYREHEVG